MNKIKEHKNCMALLALMLIVGTTALAGWAKSHNAGSGIEPRRAILPSEAHISDLTLGKDKKITEPTEEFATDETIFAAVEIADNQATLKVKGRLHVVEIAGQKPGPIAALDVIVTIKGENTANFSLTKPNNGWPLGKYKFEALLLNAKGETIDSASHEFIVH